MESLGSFRRLNDSEWKAYGPGCEFDEPEIMTDPLLIGGLDADVILDSKVTVMVWIDPGKGELAQFTHPTLTRQDGELLFGSLQTKANLSESLLLALGFELICDPRS